MVRIKDFITLNRSKNKPDEELDNSVVLEENKEIYNIAFKALYDRKHKNVLQALFYFIENDLYLRRNIAKLLKTTDSETKEPITFAQHAELQSYYNSFRTTLISDIVTYLVKAYNNVGKNIHQFDTASMWYNYAERVNEFYIHKVKEFLTKHQQEQDGYGQTDIQLIKMCSEVIDVFEEIKKLSYRTIRKMIQFQVKESSGPRTLFLDSDLDDS